MCYIMRVYLHMLEDTNKVRLTHVERGDADNNDQISEGDSDKVLEGSLWML